MGRGLGAGAHLVVVEADIHGPVQAVLDGPMGTDGAGDAGCVGSQTAEVEALLAGGLVADPAFRFQRGEAAQPFPLPGLIEAFH